MLPSTFGAVGTGGTVRFRFRAFATTSGSDTPAGRELCSSAILAAMGSVSCLTAGCNKPEFDDTAGDSGDDGAAPRTWNRLKNMNGHELGHSNGHVAHHEHNKGKGQELTRTRQRTKNGNRQRSE